MSSPSHKSLWNLWALFLLLPVPTLAVLVKMVWWADAPWATSVFLVCKLWVLLLPLVLTYRLGWGTLRIPAWQSKGLATGIGVGVLSCLAIIAAWFWIAEPWLGADGINMFRERMQSQSPLFAHPAGYILAATLYCLFNSIMEEYVWRWFAVERAKALVGTLVSIVAINLVFGVHHMFAVQAQSGGIIIPLLAAAGVVLGGLIWSVIYHKSGNIWAAWIAHVGADVGVFAVGGWIAFGQ